MKLSKDYVEDSIRIYEEFHRHILNWIEDELVALRTKCPIGPDNPLRVRISRIKRKAKVYFKYGLYYFSKQKIAENYKLELFFIQETKNFLLLSPDQYRQFTQMCEWTEAEWRLVIQNSSLLGNNPNELFGRILLYRKKYKNILKYVFTNPYRRVQKPQRKRGYDDKGHMGDSSSFKYNKYMTRTLEEIEQERLRKLRKEHEDIIGLSRGWYS